MSQRIQWYYTEWLQGQWSYHTHLNAKNYACGFIFMHMCFFGISLGCIRNMGFVGVSLNKYDPRHSTIRFLKNFAWKYLVKWLSISVLINIKVSLECKMNSRHFNGMNNEYSRAAEFLGYIYKGNIILFTKYSYCMYIWHILWQYDVIHETICACAIYYTRTRLGWVLRLIIQI